MKVRVKTNLGSMDAKKLGLNHEDYKYEDEKDIDDELAKKLIEKGIVEEVKADEPKPLRGVAPKPAVADAGHHAPDDFKSNPHSPPIKK